MKPFDLRRYVAGTVAALLLAGCGGAGTPTIGNGLPTITGNGAQNAAHGKSWMLPEATSQDLLYVSVSTTNYTDSEVQVYSYSSNQLVGTLTGFKYATSLCSDTIGDVFVIDIGKDE